MRKVVVGSRFFLIGCAANSFCSPPLVAGAAATTRIRLVASDARGFSVAMESLASSAANNDDGVARDRWTIYGAKKSPGCAGDQESRAIVLLPSRARLGIYAKFALSLPSCPKCKLQIQNHWISLFVIFGKL